MLLSDVCLSGRLGINHSGAHGVGSLRDAVCQMQLVKPHQELEAYSPGAQKHLFHISSTKGLRPGLYASMIGDPKKAILKFCIFAQQPGGASNTP